MKWVICEFVQFFLFFLILLEKSPNPARTFLINLLENQLLLISINFTPKTSHSCLKKWYTRLSRLLVFCCFFFFLLQQNSTRRAPLRVVFPEFDPLAWSRADRSSAGSATSIDTHVSQEGSKGVSPSYLGKL